jgi:hypothetical protein
MRSALRHWWVLVVCAVVAVPAGLALAAKPAAQTLSASAVTATSASLNGIVETAGSTTTWQFQYGTSTNFAHATPIQQITGGGNKAHAVAATISSLAPGTTYYFRLVVTTSKGSPQASTSYGNVLSFMTARRGFIVLRSRHLRVKRGHVLVPVGCFSELPCTGRFSITTRTRLAATHRLANIGCASKFFSLRPSASVTLRAKLTPACRSLIRGAPHHRIRAKFTSRPRTGQLGLAKRVTLRRG